MLCDVAICNIWQEHKVFRDQECDNILDSKGASVGALYVLSPAVAAHSRGSTCPRVSLDCGPRGKQKKTGNFKFHVVYCK